MNELLSTMTLVALLGAGIIAGVFFAFSTFVMRALARIPAPEGIRAMQQINLTVINPWFLGTFFGTAILSLAAAVLALTQTTRQDGVLVCVASALYVLGCFGVTIALNVPLNNRLAAADANSKEASTLWQHYLSRWTLWNTVRTIASLAAAALFALAGWDMPVAG